MGNKANNKLFILLTDACNLGCEFCNFRYRREDCQENSEASARLKRIDVDRGYARESIGNLVSESFVVGFSGGGEPMLNLENMVKILSLGQNRRFIITSNGSIEKERLERMFDTINDQCAKNNNRWVFRLSIDRFHDNSKNFIDNLETLLSWNQQKKWSHSGGLFFRTNIIDEEYVKGRFETVCAKAGWELEWDHNSDEFARWIRVGGAEYRLLLRPIVGLAQSKVKDKFDIYEYTDLLSSTDGHDITIGVPKGCHGCQGCKGGTEIACQIINGLDITIDTDGKAYVYGGEITDVGCIYDEVLTHDIIRERISQDPLLQKLLSTPLKELMRELGKNPEFKAIIEDTNYPYSIIRCLKEKNEDLLKKTLSEMR